MEVGRVETQSAAREALDQDLSFETPEARAARQRHQEDQIDSCMAMLCRLADKNHPCWEQVDKLSRQNPHVKESSSRRARGKSSWNKFFSEEYTPRYHGAQVTEGKKRKPNSIMGEFSTDPSQVWAEKSPEEKAAYKSSQHEMMSGSEQIKRNRKQALKETDRWVRD
jgi:hypothetical protein